MENLFLGIIVGVCLNKFLFPCIEILTEVFIHKNNSKVTSYRIQSQKTMRDFEESKGISRNIVGFDTNYEEEEDFEEDID